MRTLTLISTIASILLFSSCRKQNIEPEQKEDIFSWLAKVKDSCSYTIDSKVYICEQLGGEGWGNSGMNLDTSNGQWKWNPDSLLYNTEFRFHSLRDNISDNSYLHLIFTKKYGKNQLAPKIGTMLAPASDMDLYRIGLHKFAVDFGRFNNDEGVVLTMDKWTGSSFERLSTISNTPVSLPTTIGPQSHNNSEFEILKVQPLPYGYDGHIIEARFSATVFNKDEQAKRVENGYVRFRIDE